MEKSGELKDKETPEMKKRLIASLCFLIPLMYLSMGHMMWGWKVPEIVSENHVAMGIIQLLLTTAVMVINQKFFISGVRGLFHKAPNMDTLVALGAGASYGYSYLCSVCDDRCADAWECGRSNDIICMSFILNLRR